PEMICIEISKIMKLCKNTIWRYLKKGKILGWCEYNLEDSEILRKQRVKKGTKKACSKKVEIFKDNKSLGIFPSCCELDRQSQKIFGVKLLQSSISHVCIGKQKQHKGYTFKYIINNTVIY
ncbi:MAG TPA: hypothetical protein VIM42_03935, partial [Clostridium sp.]